MTLKYSVGEKITISRPVNRISYICQAVKGKKVLDLGCWDETALVKRNSKMWLHEEISNEALDTIGIDNSISIPEEGVTLKNSKILKGDCTNQTSISGFDIDVIVAGELIEHLPNAIEFLATLKKLYSGKTAILTTPNATNLSNILLALLKRESMHIDHVNIYSYKTLSSLCRRSEFKEFVITPYYVRYTEMKFNSSGLKKLLVAFMEKLINIFEFIFPLLAGGYVVIVKI